ncbi:hypothetical protein HGA64_01465 [Candidatus Falkowbacteria bacterium]|nr:hypothetical protein [Candidatus Falkowbacteria bacterium]
MAWTLASTGVMMILLAVLVVFFNFWARLVFGVLIVVLASVFFYLAEKFWWLRKELDKLFKLK